MVGTLALVGCGGGDDNKSNTSATNTSTTTSTTPAAAGGGGQTLKLSADPGGQLKFDKSKLTAKKAGKVTLSMSNPSSAGIQHAIAVEGNGVDKDGPTVDPGKTSTVTADLKPGKYEFYCPVDGHKAAGMEGTLLVK
jgi:uncharacterized cupredoxin-like copper-binding protein